MDEQYTAPELKLVGEAKDVVFGNGFLGVDFWNEVLSTDFEFQMDSKV